MQTTPTSREYAEALMTGLSLWHEASPDDVEKWVDWIRASKPIPADLDEVTAKG